MDRKTEKVTSSPFHSVTSFLRPVCLSAHASSSATRRKWQNAKTTFGTKAVSKANFFYSSFEFSCLRHYLKTGKSSTSVQTNTKNRFFEFFSPTSQSKRDSSNFSFTSRFVSRKLLLPSVPTGISSPFLRSIDHDGSDMMVPSAERT